MSVCVLDFETTGPEPKKDRPLEVYAKGVGEYHAFMWDPSYPEISNEITELTGIDLLKAQSGVSTKQAITELCDLLSRHEWVAGHNVLGFDWLLLESECARHNVSLPKVKLIDTMVHLPLSDRIKCRRLSHIAVELGLIVDGSKLHGAKADVELCKAVLDKFDLAQVKEISLSPLLLLRAHTTFETKELAKKGNFRWNAEVKRWEKNITEYALEKERAKCKEIGFEFEVIRA